VPARVGCELGVADVAAAGDQGNRAEALVRPPRGEEDLLLAALARAAVENRRSPTVRGDDARAGGLSVAPGPQSLLVPELPVRRPRGEEVAEQRARPATAAVAADHKAIRPVQRELRRREADRAAAGSEGAVGAERRPAADQRRLGAVVADARLRAGDRDS